MSLKVAFPITVAVFCCPVTKGADRSFDNPVLTANFLKKHILVETKSSKSKEHQVPHPRQDHRVDAGITGDTETRVRLGLQGWHSSTRKGEGEGSPEAVDLGAHAVGGGGCSSVQLRWSPC